MITNLIKDTCWGNYWECNSIEIIFFGLPSLLIGISIGYIIKSLLIRKRK